MNTKIIVSKSSEQTFELGKEMAKNLKGGEVFALHGDLGSGKTVFAQGLASGLGVTQKVTSPTFLILKHYQLKDQPLKDMYHADLYRIESEQEVKEIGLVEMMKDPDAVTVIEWPEKMANVLPNDTMHLTFFYDGEDHRLIIEGKLEAYINHAVEVLKRGGVIIYPTDTAFGIGCRADSETAVKKLFAVTKRPANKATPELFDSIEMVEEYVEEIPRDVRENLVEKYWPGALTIVLQAQKERVADLVLGGDTIGVRIPGNEIIREIIRKVGVPIVGTSANFSGLPTTYHFKDLDPKLCDLVDLVVPGVCTVQRESTIIDASVKPWKILRQGAVVINN